MTGAATGGVIVLAATPIGDVEDASARLVRLLGEADLIAAEDTRRLRALASRLGVQLSARVLSYHEHNEHARTETVLQAASEGGTVLVVTDAGMPAVSDPGFRLVRAAAEAGVRVTAAPGPSAALTALALSGLPSDRFCFEGFPPRKPGERDRALATLATEQRTMIFFESPHRIAATLQAMAGAFGPDRAAAVCRELTKTYEEVRRGPLAALAEWASDQVRGELSIVVAGAAPDPADPQDLLAEVLRRTEAGERLKDVTAELAAVHRVSRRELYEAALRAR
ncbi:16S rRNA (cytidine(1402)-2'-O)-methyltransferase [Ruania albidiflava]|uniref:16S rRNA (cytidine(1402)-2'-O)-methyltransferase n=1 Tax=Ruania albidiflava TaxID=366586 RepID=UPI0003B3C895|nr:16S rRNA (cytidine(1402)-2'-O)-methyltransferase [Ruania albidiflava]